MKTNNLNSPAHARLANEAVQAYREISSVIRAATLPGWVTVELSISQVRAVVLLAHHGLLSVSGLARLLGIGNPAASILVQQLVEQDFVERSEDPEDRRRSLLRLTGHGQKLISERQEQIGFLMRGWMECMDGEDLECLVRGFNALAKIARSELPPVEQALEHNLGERE